MNNPLNKSLSIDKSNWTKVKLGEVVAEPRDTVKDFASEQIEHVVGLEHIDSEDIHLRRSVSMDSNTTFTKKFLAGDVLFGRRRAYLKKTAQAKFSGICSGDITVMRAKKDLLPELLPFVVNNDKFFDYAVKHSAGGLSPRVKFKDLADYEFLLPPKDQQAQLAELLWAMDEMVEKDKQIFNKEKTLKDSLRAKYFSINNSKKTIRIGDVADLTAGGTPSTAINDYWDNGTVLWMSSGEVHKKRLFDTDKKITELGLKNSSAKFIPIHSCLIALAGQGKTKGTVAINEVELTTNQSVAAIIPDKEKINPYYLFHNLDSRYIDLRNITGEKNSRIGLNLQILKNFIIAYHSNDEMKEIAGLFNSLDENINVIDKKINSSKDLLKSLINQIF